MKDLNYSFAKSQFGEIIIASTSKGIAYLAFFDGRKKALADLRKRFSGAVLAEKTDSIQRHALRMFTRGKSGSGSLPAIKLDLNGTDFQMKVWKALLEIPSGELSTYSAIAQRINHPKAVRAVGTAVGQNPVAFLVPCHRVIQSSGAFGNYHWGAARKKAMIESEVSKPEKI